MTVTKQAKEKLPINFFGIGTGPTGGRTAFFDIGFRLNSCLCLKLFLLGPFHRIHSAV
jgi:hypothetical protein